MSLDRCIPRLAGLSRILSPLVLSLGLGVLTALAGGASEARESVVASVGSSAVPLSDLPEEARQTHKSILAGGPFPFPHKDGSVFGNRERTLPVEPRGFYREYTVPTPRSKDRGARRIVCGGVRPTAPEVCFYTQDHYASFRRIVQ